jgi:uncharacterized damage-inducible protein DinB
MIIPTARVALLQHALDTYGSETEKTCATWQCFTDADLDWRPHARSMTVREVLRHQLLSERRFFAEFLGLAEPAAANVLPREETVAAFALRLKELAEPRLPQLAAADEAWWRGPRMFFDVERERVWIFWRRVLHSAHHRTQLTVYLRLLDRAVPSTYGPTADVTWTGATPTLAV